MNNYTNPRAARVHRLLWAMTAGTALTAALGVYGWLAGDPTAAEAGAITSPILLIFAVGLEAYCRRYVIALQLERDGTVRLQTRSLTGTHIRTGTAQLGAARRDGAGSSDSVWEALASAHGSVIDNRYHILRLDPGGRRFIVDVTADPAVGARLRRALGNHRA